MHRADDDRRSLGDQDVETGQKGKVVCLPSLLLMAVPEPVRNWRVSLSPRFRTFVTFLQSGEFSFGIKREKTTSRWLRVLDLSRDNLGYWTWLGSNLISSLLLEYAAFPSRGCISRDPFPVLRGPLFPFVAAFFHLHRPTLFASGAETVSRVLLHSGSLPRLARFLRVTKWLVIVRGFCIAILLETFGIFLSLRQHSFHIHTCIYSIYALLGTRSSERKNSCKNSPYRLSHRRPFRRKEVARVNPRLGEGASVRYTRAAHIARS